MKKWYNKNLEWSIIVKETWEPNWIIFYWFLEREKGGERERHQYAVPPIHAFIGWFLYVLWLGIQPTTLVHWDDALTHWALLLLMHVLSPWPEISYFFIFYLDSVLLTVELATLHHHPGLSSSVSTSKTPPFTPFPSINDCIICYRSRERAVVDTWSYADNRVSLFFNTVTSSGQRLWASYCYPDGYLIFAA